MTKMKYILLLLVIITLSLIGFGACNPYELIELNTARVEINSGIKIGASGGKAAVIDVVSFQLKVEAADMTTFETSFTDSTVSIDVEAGAARTFTLNAFDANENIIFTGSKTVDLTAGETIDIPISMEYAGFYVSFVTNCDTTLDSVFVSNGRTIAVPDALQKTGYTFGGWFEDDGTFLNQWVFTTDTVTEDLTLYAKWSQETYTGEITTGDETSLGWGADYYADFWAVSFPSTTSVTVDIMGDNGGLGDTYIYLHNSSSLLGSNDDGGEGANARYTHTFDGGVTYYIEATTYSSGVTGTYVIELSEVPTSMFETSAPY